MSVSTNMIAEGELRLRLDRIQSWALAAGGLGLFLSLVAWWLWREQFLQQFLPSYLVAYVFWVGLALGCMGLTMLHHLVGGSWGLVVRRPMEPGGMTLLPLALLFVPLALGAARGGRPRPAAPAQEPLSERWILPGADRRLLRDLVRPRICPQPPVQRPGQARRPSPERLAPVAQRAGSRIAVSDRDILGDRLADVAGATLVLDDLRQLGDRG